MTGIKEYIADEAKRIVSGARRADYGTPENNFERIARFWNAYLVNVGKLPSAALNGHRGLGITAADVSPMMRLMKEARLCETPDHLDSFIDLVGYTLTGAEVNGVSAHGEDAEDCPEAHPHMQEAYAEALAADRGE